MLWEPSHHVEFVLLFLQIDPDDELYLSKKDFFEGFNRLSSLVELQERITELKAAGLDEAIIAYRDLVDIETAARLIE